MHVAPLLLLALLSGRWTVVESTDGVVVRAREGKGRALPELEVTGEIAADFYDVIAVMLEFPKQTAWMPRVSDFRVMEAFSPDDARVYVRFDVPWPGTDREVVVRNVTRVVAPDRKVVVEQHDERIPAPPDVRDADLVRMPRLVGLFTLERVGEGRTRVTYRADADPGGMLPDWLKRMVVNAMPLRTVQLIRDVVRASRGKHGAFIAAWKARHGLR